MTVELKNETNRTLSTAGNDARYDRAAKRILSNNQILARVIKWCTTEFRDFTIDEIIADISDVSLRSVLVNPDGFVIPLNPEDSEIGSGNVYFDIHLRVTSRTNPKIRIYLDIELHNKWNDGYYITERGTYNCARLISRQAKTEFSLTNQEYRKLKKVYSIWICPEVPKYRKNSIETYSSCRKLVYGTMKKKDRKRWERIRYDLQEITAICLDPEQESDNELIQMFNIIFSKTLDSKEKLRRLRDDFGFVITTKLRKEIRIMQNLGQCLVEQTRREDYAKARKREEKMVFAAIERGETDEELTIRYLISPEKARKYRERYSRRRKKMRA